MSVWDEIQRARSLESAPPLSETDIEDVSRRAGVALPREVVELLRRCGGIEGALGQVDFSGRTIEFEAEDLFPHALAIASDAEGNFWVSDVTSDASEVAPVFFVGHDPPVVLYQSPDLEHFVRELIRMGQSPHRSLIDDVREDRSFEVWRRNPGTVSRAEAARSSDAELRAFAASLDDRFTIVDLRSPEVGMGFSWGRYGPNTIVRRHGETRMFAYAAPERRGFWSRLTGSR